LTGDREWERVEEGKRNKREKNMLKSCNVWGIKKNGQHEVIWIEFWNKPRGNYFMLKNMVKKYIFKNDYWNWMVELEG